MIEINGLLKGIKPIKRMSVSEWADSNRYLSSVSSSEPGKWKTSRTPYLKEIMDRMGPYDESVRIVFMKGSQVGVTEAAFNAMGFYIDLDPCPMLYVMPTEGTVKRNSKVRFDPMVEASPSLREKISPAKSRDKMNSTLQKSFVNGMLVFCGSNSPAPLRSLPVRVVVLDEVDAMSRDVDGEGSPIELAEARTRTFPKKKIILISTPTLKNASMIEDEYKSTSQKKYHVPCPECGTKQELVFDNLVWEADRWAETKYKCEHCDHLIEERNKPFMLANGEWIDTAPEKENPKVLGYHINALYSPWGWYSWGEAAKAYHKALSDETKMKVFVNTVLGLTYEEKGESPEHEKLFARNRLSYRSGEIDDDVVFLTAGIDVQDNRIEMEITGWCKNMITKSIQYNIIPGPTDTSSSVAYQKLSMILNQEFVRKDGAKIRISKACIDSGYNSGAVYQFCRTAPLDLVVPIKGKNTQQISVSRPSVIDIVENGQKLGVVSLYNLGVNIIKKELYGWLKQNFHENGEIPRGYCFFPENYDQEYFLQITAERLVRKEKRGYPVYEWIKVRKRNEALDCRVYSRAAASMLGLDFLEDDDWISINNTIKYPPPPRKKGKKRKSTFWDR